MSGLSSEFFTVHVLLGLGNLSALQNTRVSTCQGFWLYTNMWMHSEPDKLSTISRIAFLCNLSNDGDDQLTSLLSLHGTFVSNDPIKWVAVIHIQWNLALQTPLKSGHLKSGQSSLPFQPTVQAVLYPAQCGSLLLPWCHTCTEQGHSTSQVSRPIQHCIHHCLCGN